MCILCTPNQLQEGVHLPLYLRAKINKWRIKSHSQKEISHNLFYKVVQKNAPIRDEIVCLFVSSYKVTNRQLQEQKLALWMGWVDSSATGLAMALTPGRIHVLQVFPSHAGMQWIPPHHRRFTNSVLVLLALGCMFLRVEVSLIYLWSACCLALTKGWVINHALRSSERCQSKHNKSIRTYR